MNILYDNEVPRSRCCTKKYIYDFDKKVENDKANYIFKISNVTNIETILPSDQGIKNKVIKNWDKLSKLIKTMPNHEKDKIPSSNILDRVIYSFPFKNTTGSQTSYMALQSSNSYMTCYVDVLQPEIMTHIMKQWVDLGLLTLEEASNLKIDKQKK